MKNNLLRFKIPVHSQEWFNFRTVGTKDYAGGWGASEVAVILNLSSQYRPVLTELWNWKVGSDVISPRDNQAMFHGRHLEEYVKRLWECDDGTDEGYMARFENWSKAITGIEKTNKLFRRAFRVNAYLVNPDYPFLFCSLDYASADMAYCMMAKHSKYEFGAGVPGGFPVECKTIGHFESQRWKEGVPYRHVVQINQQMLITDTYYAELPVLEDGRFFRVHRFERDEELCKEILRKGKRLWDTVLEAREYLKYANSALKNYNTEEFEKWMGKLQHIEPDVTDNPKYKEYLSERHQSEPEILKGTYDMYKYAVMHKIITAIIKELTRRKTKLTNILTKKFVDSKVERIEFEKFGYLKYALRKGDVFKSMSNYAKYDVDKKVIEKVVEDIKLKGV